MKSTLFILASLLIAVFVVNVASGQTTCETMGQKNGFNVAANCSTKTAINWQMQDYTTVVCGGVISPVSVVFRQRCGGIQEGMFANHYEGESLLCQSYQYNAARKCVTVTYADGRTAQYYHI